MKYSFSFKPDRSKSDQKTFDVYFRVVYYNTLSDKAKEKIYKIIRIIDSINDDSIDETTDSDYRFQTDDDNGEEILDGVIHKG